MMQKRTLLNLTALSLFLLAGGAIGQDWLLGGYASSIGPYNWDPAIAGLRMWLDYPAPTVSLYGMNGSVYYLPYSSAYSPYPMAYYSIPGWTPLYAAGWQVYQQDWAKTLEYAQTRSSIRVYPIRPVMYTPSQPAASTSTATALTQTAATPAATPAAPSTTALPTATTTYYSPQYVTTSPAAAPAPSAVSASPQSTSGDSTAIIISQGMRGYQVFLDGVYIGTEGTGGDPLDGRFTFRVTGNRNHEIRVYDGQFNYPKIMFFDYGGTKTIYVEPGTAVYI